MSSAQRRMGGGAAADEKRPSGGHSDAARAAVRQTGWPLIQSFASAVCAVCACEQMWEVARWLSCVDTALQLLLPGGTPSVTKPPAADPTRSDPAEPSRTSAAALVTDPNRTPS